MQEVLLINIFTPMTYWSLMRRMESGRRSDQCLAREGHMQSQSSIMVLLRPTAIDYTASASIDLSEIQSRLNLFATFNNLKLN